MRQLFRRGLLALALILPVAIGGLGASPAHAADNAWSFSWCYPTTVMWYGVPGLGTWYYDFATPGLYYWMDGGWFQEYLRQGSECGPLGPPRSGVVVAAGAGNSWSGITQDRIGVGGRFLSAEHIHFRYGCIARPWSNQNVYQTSTPCNFHP